MVPVLHMCSNTTMCSSVSAFISFSVTASGHEQTGNLFLVIIDATFVVHTLYEQVNKFLLDRAEGKQRPSPRVSLRTYNISVIKTGY